MNYFNVFGPVIILHVSKGLHRPGRAYHFTNHNGPSPLFDGWVCPVLKLCPAYVLIYAINLKESRPIICK